MNTLDFSNWGWPQWTYFSLMLFVLAGTVIMHGKPRGPYSLGDTVLSMALTFLILLAGGFWS